MEFRYLALSALFCLALVGSHASLTVEDYWQSIWPNTPMPKSVRDALTGSAGPKDTLPFPTSFFFERDLRPGKKMNLHFNKNSNAQPYAILYFMAYKDLETKVYTLEEICEKKSIKGEDKFCTSSLESLFDFTISNLGNNIEAFSSSFFQKQEQYTIEEAVRKVGDMVVIWHKLNFQDDVFYCHKVNATRAYTVPLVTADGTKIEAVAVCHTDTSEYDPQHPALVTLNVKPGTVPVCHFLGSKTVLWVPNSDMKKAYEAS